MSSNTQTELLTKEQWDERYLTDTMNAEEHCEQMDDYVENYLDSHDIYIPFTELVAKYKRLDDLGYFAGMEEFKKMTECEEDGYCISDWFQEKMRIHMKYQLTNPNGEYYDAVKHLTPIPHCFDYFVADYTKMKDENEKLKKEIEELKVHNTRGHIITEGIDMHLTEVCDKYLELKEEQEVLKTDEKFAYYLENDFWGLHNKLAKENEELTKANEQLNKDNEELTYANGELQEQGQGLAVQYAEVCKEVVHLRVSQHPNHDLIPKDFHGWEAIEKLKEDEQEWCEEEMEWLHYSETKKWRDAHR